MASVNKNNTTCIICGQKYHLCIACERKKATWKSWRRFVDNENCYEIYNILNSYKFNKITKLEAKEMLNDVDLSNLENFKEKVQNEIKDILTEEKTVKKSRRKKKNDLELSQEFQESIEVLEENLTDSSDHILINDQIVNEDIEGVNSIQEDVEQERILEVVE